MHGEKAYFILRQAPFTKFEDQPNMEYLKMYRDWVGADHVLKSQTHYLFCETIEDIEYEAVTTEEKSKKTVGASNG